MWAKGFGSIYDDLANAVAVDGGGNALVTGYFQNTMDLGGQGGTLNTAGQSDMFVVGLGQ